MMDRNKKKSSAVKAQRRLPKAIQYLAILLFFITSYEVGVRYAEPRLLPIRHIQMARTFEKVNIHDLETQIKPEIKGFFTTNVMALKRRIQSIPFVDEVYIRRLWPDTLLITIKEVALIAAWGKDQSVTSRGEVIAVSTDSVRHLPIFNGPEGQAKPMLELFNQLSAALRPFNLAILELDLNLRHSWQITLDNGIKVILGRKEVMAHFNSFLSVYPKLKKRHPNNIESIDLRHPNGVSVHLRSE